MKKDAMALVTGKPVYMDDVAPKDPDPLTRLEDIITVILGAKSPKTGDILRQYVCDELWTHVKLVSGAHACRSCQHCP